MPLRNSCTNTSSTTTPGYVLEELEEQPRVDNPEVRGLKEKAGGVGE